MAVLPEHQKKGFGERLLAHAEKRAREANTEILWFNARLHAIPFYEKFGYDRIGDPFDIGDIGTHYVMYKQLA